MDDLRVSAWALFHELFKVGDDVVLVDAWDTMLAGRLVQISETGCSIRPALPEKWNRKTRQDVDYKWEDIRFMSQMGFPVSKLMGADDSPSIEQLDTTDLQEALRFTLMNEYDHISGTWDVHPQVASMVYRKPRRAGQIVFGDPFLVEDVEVSLYNPGNCGDAWWGEDFEETLVLHHPGTGKSAHLWSLDTVYHVSGLGVEAVNAAA
jgi:hypothetical protein